MLHIKNLHLGFQELLMDAIYLCLFKAFLTCHIFSRLYLLSRLFGASNTQQGTAQGRNSHPLNPTGKRCCLHGGMVPGHHVSGAHTCSPAASCHMPGIPHSHQATLETVSERHKELKLFTAMVSLSALQLLKVKTN